MNEAKYYNPEISRRLPNSNNERSTPEISPEALTVFNYFHKKRKELDPGYEYPVGTTKKGLLSEIEMLLKNRSVEDVKKLIDWSTGQKFWCTCLSTPSKLKKHFSEAWIEMLASRSNQGKNEETLNRIKEDYQTKGMFFTHRFGQNLSNGRNNVIISVKNKYFEYEDEGEFLKYVNVGKSSDIETFKIEVSRVLEDAFRQLQDKKKEWEKRKGKENQHKQINKKIIHRIEEAKKNYHPILDHLRKRGHSAEWGVNGELKLNGCIGYTFLNKASFLDETRGFLNTDFHYDNCVSFNYQSQTALTMCFFDFTLC